MFVIGGAKLDLSMMMTLNIYIYIQLFIQFNERKREEQVLSLLAFQFETLETPKELGNSKQGTNQNKCL